MTLIQEFLSKVQSRKVRIAVLGDAMIDEYYYVKCTGVSPEFPIPVMKSSGFGRGEPYAVPGGAANVAHQFKHFNTEAVLFGFLDDYAKEVCHRHGVEYAGASLRHPAYCPIKRRFYDGDHPTYRWDVEQYNYAMEEEYFYQVSKELQTSCENHGFLGGSVFDAVIYSDYDKGVFHRDPFTAIRDEPWWFASSRVKVPVIVDPKGDDLNKWRGCTIFKPNCNEATRMSGLTHPKSQCEYFLKKLGCQAVIITCGGSGFVGMTNYDYFTYEPKQRTQASSVIGAGDCFSVFLALAITYGFPVREAAEVAFEAGRVYVQKRHNTPITPQELLAWVDPVSAKLVEPKSLYEQHRHEKLVFTNGCFDVLHAGHLELLNFAKSKGDKLVVAVNDDASVARLKGSGRPYNCLVDRMEMLASLQMVDHVVSFSEDTPERILDEIKPEVLVKGSEYEQSAIVGADKVKEVFRCPMLSGFSTTGLMKKVKPG